MIWKPSNLPYDKDLETRVVLKKLAGAHRALAELKGIAQTIPKQEILINTLMLQEAKDSSEVENIVTTHDDLYKSSLGLEKYISPAAKEVQNYVAAIKRGFAIVSEKKILTTNNIIEIQEILEKNKAGLRKIPGTNLKNQQTGEVIYEPPQSAKEIKELMENLELFINDNSLIDYDPIVKMAIIHFQFESIHPFYDGNGRTGRILNILYLVLNDLLEIPILYLSRFIISDKMAYYQNLQNVRDNESWETWLLYMISAVEETAYDTIRLVNDIKKEMMKMKNILRNNYKFYSQELLNHLFKQPYTKIEFLKKDLGVSRVTASGYLNRLAEDKVIFKFKLGKTNYYINMALMNALSPENKN
ncbi:Fic family protein [Lutibacter sp. Hel_I_33_5]|uniref:Fic family protein n=1 Tax=Lutibacter sp. Hel_I_33_5 TaxID=1566289 RepID=UPI00119ECA8A|nr:Fic family protein [Lutibacter sp. Hel_I_33_5]TVZ56454.1 Fic family protein [Lutibacter sp. Hel_I_33_5]